MIPLGSGFAGVEDQEVPRAEAYALPVRNSQERAPKGSWSFLVRLSGGTGPNQPEREALSLCSLSRVGFANASFPHRDEAKTIADMSAILRRAATRYLLNEHRDWKSSMGPSARCMN